MLKLIYNGTICISTSSFLSTDLLEWQLLRYLYFYFSLLSAYTHMLLINIYSRKAQIYSPDHIASKIILIKPFRSTSRYQKLAEQLGNICTCNYLWRGHCQGKHIQVGVTYTGPKATQIYPSTALVSQQENRGWFTVWPHMNSSPKTFRFLLQHHFCITDYFSPLFLHTEISQSTWKPSRWQENYSWGTLCPQNLTNCLYFAINILKISFETNPRPQRCSTLKAPSKKKMLKETLTKQKPDCPQCQNHYPSESNIHKYHSITASSLRKALAFPYPLLFVPPHEFTPISVFSCWLLYFSWSTREPLGTQYFLHCRYYPL